MKFELELGEEVLGTWSLIYRPDRPELGGPYNGKLTVTNHRLLYDALYTIDVTALLDRINDIDRQRLRTWESEGYLEIAKSSVVKAEVSKSFLRKAIVLTLSDGTRHSFDRGAMSIDAAAAAIQAR